MIKIYNTTTTTIRHNDFGHCEESDFGTIELFVMPKVEKELIVSFKDYNKSKEFIKVGEMVYVKFDEESNVHLSREEQANWLKKQGRFSADFARKFMVELRKKECSYSNAFSQSFILIEKTLYVKYCNIEKLNVTVCGNISFSHWISIDIESHGGKNNYPLRKSSFEKIVKEQHKLWVSTKEIKGDGHSIFSKPTNIKWGENYKH